MQLFHIVVQERQPDKHEQNMRAKNLERRLAQGQEGLDRNQRKHDPPQPVEDHCECNEVEHAQRPDVPFIERKGQRSLRKARPQPAVAHPEEEDASASRHGDCPARHPLQRHLPFSRLSPQPQPGHPDRLPRQQVEGPCLLQGNLQVGEPDNLRMQQLAAAHLRRQPERTAGKQQIAPTPAHAEGEHDRARRKENNVHRQNIEQGRAVEQQHGAQDRRRRVRDVEVEQVRNCRAVRRYGKPGGDGKRKDEHEQVNAVDLERSFPQLGSQSGLVGKCLAAIDARHQQR